LTLQDLRVKDTSGNDNDGELIGASYVPGKIGKALYFDGINDYVTIGQPTGIVPPKFPWTYSLWINMFSFPSVEHNGFLGIDSAFLFYLNYLTGKISFYFHDGVTPNIAVNSRVATGELNKWIHLVCVHDGSYMRLYWNTTEDDNTPSEIQVPDINLDFYIGGNIPARGYFEGLIDEVCIYNRALLIAEIEAAMNGNPPRNGLVGEWKMEKWWERPPAFF